MEARARTHELTLMAFMATVVMLFAAFTAAYLIRRSGPDWERLPLPDLIWVNTVVLLASSGTMELARRRGDRRWLLLTTALGAAFVIGQLFVWKQWSAAGVFVSSYPYSSFLYVLTAVHGLHLLGGVLALCYALSRPEALPLCALYWHFVDGLWVYLMGVLTLL